jgi:CARDB
MNPVRCALVVLSLLVASFAATAPAGARTALPNLVVTKISKPPKTKTVGSKIKLVVKVADKGGSSASASKLGLYLAKGKKHTKKDKRLKRVKVKALAGGKSQKLKLKALLPEKTKPGVYRLFACADDSRKVKEAKEGDNCRGSKKLRLVASAKAVARIPVASIGPSNPPAAAFSMSDGLDWGFVENSNQELADAEDPVTVNLTAANGIPGQAGYTRAATVTEAFRTGNATSLDYSGAANSGDDGQVTVPLPFAFPFGGIKEDSISVSTNGWVSFRSPAWDFWDDEQPGDYRGVQAVVGELERGIMPYWDDLDVGDQGAGTGTVTEVVAPDNSWVAFQWDLGQHGAGTPRRTFQLVLFPDGSFRIDYPGTNEEGGNEAFVGYSLGTGAGSADVVAENTESVPATSLLFKPNAVPAAGPTDAGTVSTTLPKGSAFVSADSGCTLATAPTATSTGLVSCNVPSLASGQQAARNVTFSMPPNAPGESSPANFRYLGTYTAGSVKLTDGDEVDALSASLESTTIKIETTAGPGSIEAGVPMTFKVKINAQGSSLDEPTAVFEVKKATIDSVKISGQALECTPLGGRSATCVLPSGSSSDEVELTLIPDADKTLEVKTTVQALNAPSASQGLGFLSL